MPGNSACRNQTWLGQTLCLAPFYVLIWVFSSHLLVATKNSVSQPRMAHMFCFPKPRASEVSLTRRGTQTPVPHFLWGLALTPSLPWQHHKALPIDFSLTQAQSTKEADAKELWGSLGWDQGSWRSVGNLCRNSPSI